MEKEEGKRPRRSAAKGTPRRTSAKKAATKLKKAKEADRQVPLARGTGSPSLKGSALEEEGLEATEGPESQGNLIIETQNKEIKEAGGVVTS